MLLTVLYGSRGASGVILITTKKVRKEKSSITFNSSFNVGTVNRLPDYQNEYARFNGTLTPAQIGSALVPNRSNASGLMVSSSWGPKIGSNNYKLIW
jgi:outer membrane receptor for ferrienterochelin and colicin